MINCRIHSTLGRVFLAFVLAAPLPVSADSGPAASPSQSGDPAGAASPEAQESALVRTGLERLEKQNDVEGALQIFEKAHAVRRNPRILFLVAKCHFRARRYIEAREYMERLLVKSQEWLSPEEIAAAKASRDSANERIPRLTIEGPPPGSEVLVDDVQRSVIPLRAPIELNPGHHVILVRKEGYRDGVRTLELFERKESNVSMNLERLSNAGALVIHAGPEDSIAVDDRPVGVGSYRSSIEAGTHTVVISRPGMKTFRKQIALSEGTHHEENVTLEPAPEGGGIPTWALIVGGSVVATGAAVGGYFLFKKSPVTRSDIEVTQGTFTIQAW